MLALLVVMIGIVAVIGLLGTSLDTAAKSQDDLHAVSFADMVFNYYHSVTNWNEIPPEGSLTVPDYNENAFTLKLDTLGQFTCHVPPMFGNAEESTYTVSYILDAQAAGSLKALTLQIWPGLGTNGSSRTFYTELYNWVDK
jgi:hypothetical protein